MTTEIFIPILGLCLQVSKVVNHGQSIPCIESSFYLPFYIEKPQSIPCDYLKPCICFMLFPKFIYWCILQYIVSFSMFFISKILLFRTTTPLRADRPWPPRGSTDPDGGSTEEDASDDETIDHTLVNLKQPRAFDVGQTNSLL